MPIQLLAPQLINQIAAGEIVERPASVVKELLENSLDAGATRIEIEIEQGGIKRILIRDNGVGIPKSELALALARHATSKIATLEDLEQILSLGFRGEALASISSISRLTLTSSIGEQAGAWLVYAEGREMSATIKPASHPQGTSIEVLDLFFNTPARRHFLKTERTEFTHIDDVVRKIALARYDVDIILKHNGKLVRQYKSIPHLDHLPQRITTISGKLFLQSGIQLCWQQAEMALAGWILEPKTCSAQLDLQYCYVNGRITKDKLLMHAIRQAYQEFIGESYPSYILYLTLPADKVDVNVHPTKQEVRFHASRLVHDFVYQAVLDALTTKTAQEPVIEPVVITKSKSEPESTAASQATGKWQAFRQQYQQQSLSNEEQQAQQLYKNMMVQPNIQSELPAQINKPTQYEPLQKLFPTRDNQLVFSPNSAAMDEPHSAKIELKVNEHLQTYNAAPPLGRVLMIYREKYAMIEHRQQLKILDLTKAERCFKSGQLQHQIQNMQQETLLLPLSWEMTSSELQGYSNQMAYNGLQALAIECTLSKNKISVNKVPLLLRRCSLQSLISHLLINYSTQLAVTNEEILRYLMSLLGEKMQWSHSEAVQLVAQLELQSMEYDNAHIEQLLINIDLEPIIKQLSYDTE